MADLTTARDPAPSNQAPELAARDRKGSMIIHTGCRHHFGSTADITRPNRAGWASEIARLAARDPGSAGCLFDCPTCRTEQVLVRVADERVIVGLPMSDYLASVDNGSGTWVSTSF